jgi:hypothetical protein
MSTVDKRVVPCKPSIVPDWKRVREAAGNLAPDEPEWGWLLWLESRLASETANPWRPMPTLWARLYRDFWRSKKRQMVGSVGRRGTKSSSNCRVAVVESLLRPRRVEPGTDLAWPFMSCDMAEANGRFKTLKALLSAIGLRAVDRQADLDIGTFWPTQPNQYGRSKIALLDADEHPFDFRIMPGTIDGASGYTAIGATCDELDLWHDKATNANPASAVLEMLRPTLKGQRDAHLYAFSAPFGERGPHTSLVRRGDTDLQHVARLGVDGAALDEKARRALADMFAARAVSDPSAEERARYARYAADVRLLEAADPATTAIPSWAANPTDENGDGPDPGGAILECYALAAGAAAADGADPLIELLARYGARPYAAGGHRMFDLTLLEAAAQRCATWP